MGREGPGWFTSSLIVFQTMGQRSTESDRGLTTTPQTQMRTRGEGGSLRGEKRPARPNGQRNPPPAKESGEEDSEDARVQKSIRTTPGLTPAPRLRQNKGAGPGVLVSGWGTPQSGGGCGATAAHGRSRAVASGDRHSARQLHKCLPDKIPEAGRLFQV